MSAAVAAASAALAVEQALALLDGTVSGSGRAAPSALSAALELDLVAGELLRRPWVGHPECTCGAPPPG